VVSFTPLPLSPLGNQTPVCIGNETGWSTEPVCTLWSRGEFLVPVEISGHTDPSVLLLVARNLVFVKSERNRCTLKLKRLLSYETLRHVVTNFSEAPPTSFRLYTLKMSEVCYSEMLVIL
jgi:hypothetical protein